MNSNAHFLRENILLPFRAFFSVSLFVLSFNVGSNSFLISFTFFFFFYFLSLLSFKFVCLLYAGNRSSECIYTNQEQRKNVSPFHSLCSFALYFVRFHHFVRRSVQQRTKLCFIKTKEK